MAGGVGREQSTVLQGTGGGISSSSPLGGGGGGGGGRPLAGGEASQSASLADGLRLSGSSSPQLQPSPPALGKSGASTGSFCSLLLLGGDSSKQPSSKPNLRKVSTDDDLLRGQVQWEIDRDEIDWRNERKLGTGTYGVVMYAKWRGTPVAVKKVNVTRGSTGGESAALEDLRHEIAVMSHMHHPRVTQFLGACTRILPWLILFEYLPGGTLASVVERHENANGVRPALATRWSLECAQGLRYLHEHKPKAVIHRDLKPSNLLVDASGTAKISDFGALPSPPPPLLLTHRPCKNA